VKGGDSIFGIPKAKVPQKHTFDELYKKYYQRVHNHISYMSGNVQIAEDIAQEAFIKLLNCKYEIEYPGAWLCKIATNQALSLIKSEKSAQDKNERIFSYMISDEINEIFETENTIIRNEEITKVRSVLAKLKKEQRDCVMLKYSGYSYDEIEKLTGIPKSNIGQHIARGKDKFLNIYKKEVPHEML
jgi:RNA polymerase sigma factor (sigma-70 family)